MLAKQKKQLKTRIVEHRNHIKRNTSTHTVITDYRIISDKRLISKMINIKFQSKGLNLQTDTDSLDRAYFSCLLNI